MGGQEHAGQGLEQPANDAAAEIKCKKTSLAQRLFDFAPKNENRQTIEQQMHKAAVHELKGQQLPDVTMPETLDAQGKILLRGEPGETGNKDLAQEGRDVDNQQHDRSRPTGTNRGM